MLLLILTELHKNILGLVVSHLLKVLAHEDFNWMLIPVLGDLLAHEMGLRREGEAVWAVW